MGGAPPARDLGPRTLARASEGVKKGQTHTMELGSGRVL